MTGKHIRPNACQQSIWAFLSVHTQVKTTKNAIDLTETGFICICEPVQVTASLIHQHNLMINPAMLRNVLPGIVTSIAIKYPIAYITSVSFMVKNQMVAACFWHKKQKDILQQDGLEVVHHDNACFVFHSASDIRSSEVEITGTDTTGKEFMVSMPYEHIVSYRTA